MKNLLKRKALFYHIVFDFTALVLLFLAVCSKVPALGRSVTENHERFGDLYGMCTVSYFKYQLPLPTCEEKLDDMDSAEVIIFGDSFAWTDDLFWCRFKEITGKRTGLIFTDEVIYSQRSNPISQLYRKGYRPTTRKVLIWERIERVVPTEFLIIDPTVKANDETIEDKGGTGSREGKPSKKEILRKLREMLIINQTNIEYCFINLPPLRWFISQANSLRFFLFGEISGRTPKYSLNPPMLFYKEEVDSYNSTVTDKQIRAIADTIEKVSNRLNEEFNIQLVFIPIPDKYVIYGDLAGAGRYSGFLPRLVKELNNRGIPAVDLYPVFMEYRRTFGTRSLLYYQSDTHWNETGANLAINEIVEFLGIEFPEVFGHGEPH